MSETNNIIHNLFTHRWCGDAVLKNLDTMKEQLFKSLTSQLKGYWSGHTAYHIMVDGGFLVDAKTDEPKVLTERGQQFMINYKNKNNI